MQKLKLKSIYKFSKSCSSSHIEHKKISFAIFGFSTIFYDFCKVQHKGSRSELLVL
jgi:hypothetical protein